VLDVKLIVENPDFVRAGLLKRISEEDFDLEEIKDLYTKLKKKRQDFENLRAQQKSFNDRVAKLDKTSEEFKKFLADLKSIAEKVKTLDSEARDLEELLNSKLEVLPNIPDEDVPAGEKESNIVLEEFGERRTFDFDFKDHTKICEDLRLVDFERAIKIAGSQFVMYTGDGARLEWALINFFINEHLKDGYEMIMPPHLLTEDSAYTAGQLPKFREDVYWVQDGNCLLPTSETALANLYRDEVLEEEDLPKKFFSYTPCYRREAGGYRAGEKGLIRVHQFNKVEMFQYTAHNQSEDAFNELVEKACRLVKQLGLHFRVSKLAAGDCSAAAARTYDVEVFLPSLDKYYEVSSVSNVTEYQSRRGNMKYNTADGTKKYLHMLNASGLATSRLMVALLETYQNKDGSVTVPEVLRKYVGKDVIKK
jgi:seryl-tRNA synthetase